jgi:DNA polymerase-3 subunit chi
LTEIAFHFNATDCLAYACRLLRKAVNRGAKLVVTGSPETLQQLDEALWIFSATDFVPHCYLESRRAMIAASPVILAKSIELAPSLQILLNLGKFVPGGFERFERVIEIVGLADQDRQLARSRWKEYADQGYAMTRHDVNLKPSY